MKKIFLLLWQITFDPLKNGLKNIFINGAKLVFFSSEIWGHFAFTFCRYLNPNMRAFIFCRYCPSILFCHQIWKTKKNSKIQGNDMGSFRRSFFPFNALDMPSFNNSVPMYYWENEKLLKLILVQNSLHFIFQEIENLLKLFWFVTSSIPYFMLSFQWLRIKKILKPKLSWIYSSGNFITALISRMANKEQVMEE